MAKTVKPRVRKVRRIVTGHDRSGRSIIVSDKPSPFVMAIRGIPTFGVTDVWKTRGTPTDNTASPEPCGMPIELAPPANGSVLRVVEFPPDRVWMQKADRESAFASMGSSGAAALARDASAARHPMMHRTKSLDYAIVLSGEIWALMDKGETKMTVGDILVQRGTNHAWANRSRKPCLVAFILVDAHPIPGLGDH